MAALIRRLGNLTKSFHAATRSRLNLTHKSLSTKVSTQEYELQNLVDKFKKSCENNKFRHSRVDYYDHVRTLANAKQFAMIEDSLEHQKRYPNIHQEGFAVRLISLYGDSGMFEHARKLFDELPALGCPRTVKSFNALLKSGVEAKEFHKVIELFNDLPSEISVEPDIHSHCTVIQALCEIGSMDEEALTNLRELGKKADIDTFNALLSTLYKCDVFSEAEKLWAETKLKPDVRSYGIRIEAMLAKKKASEALILADEMANKGIEYDKLTYNNMIVGLCENGKLKEAKKWYDDLLKSKCDRRLLVTTYFALIMACCEDGDFDKAFEICFDAVNRKISLNSTLCKRVIDGYTENGRTKKASELKKLLNCLEE